MGWTTDFSEDRRRIIRIAVAAVLILALIAGGSLGLTLLMQPKEPVGGPSTANLDMDEFFENLPMRTLLQTYQQRGYTRKDFNYAVAPGKIYFSIKHTSTIYSIDADYQNLTKITDKACAFRGALSAVNAPAERPCVMIWYDGFLYFIAKDQSSYKTGRYFLMRHETGTKVRPQTICSGGFEALGLSDGGEIILYYRPDSKWVEVRRVDPATGETES